MCGGASVCKTIGGGRERARERRRREEGGRTMKRVIKVFCAWASGEGRTRNTNFSSSGATQNFSQKLQTVSATPKTFQSGVATYAQRENLSV